MKNRGQLNELSARIDEVLYYLWDPIGVSDEPCARGEYSGYAPIITKLVLEENEHKIVMMLSQIEVINMGLPKQSPQNEKVAKRLLREKYAVESGLR